MERSNRNITKIKPSTKSKKNKQKDNAIISHNKNRNRANSKREKKKDTEEKRDTIKVIIDKQAEIKDKGPNPKKNL